MHALLTMLRSSSDCEWSTGCAIASSTCLESINSISIMNTFIQLNSEPIDCCIKTIQKCVKSIYLSAAEPPPDVADVPNSVTTLRCSLRYEPPITVAAVGDAPPAAAASASAPSSE